MAAASIVVNVRTLPDALESEMYPHLTRFQRKQSETRGPALRLRCASDETVGALKKRIEGWEGRADKARSLVTHTVSSSTLHP